MNVVVKGDVDDVSLGEKEAIEETSGKLAFQAVDDKLMHLVLENDQETVEKGKVIQESLDSGFGSLTPDLFFEKLVSNYRWARKMFGDRLIRLMTGYDPQYVENNRAIPEFRRELRARITRRVDELRRAGLLDRDNSVTEKGVELSSLLLFVEELEHLKAQVSGERQDKKAPPAASLPWAKPFRGERYKDIAVRKTLRTAIRRGHRALQRSDLRVFERDRRGEQYVVYAIDCSGSMKGDKLRNAKKAGVALAYRAVQERGKVGLLTFSKDVKEKVMPGSSFVEILSALARLHAKQETDLAGAVKEAMAMFPDRNVPRHLILLTDSLPTIGTSDETLRAVSEARGRGITVSLIGLNLTAEGARLSERIVEIGEGRLYHIRDLETLDTIILEEYEHARAAP